LAYVFARCPLNWRLPLAEAFNRALESSKSQSPTGGGAPKATMAESEDMPTMAASWSHSRAKIGVVRLRVEILLRLAKKQSWRWSWSRLIIT
jgi:hypothetical protein